MAGKKKQEAAAGAPAWIVTFADLCTLLMTFFILIIALSNTDQKKYLELAGSMRDAFGMDAGAAVNQVPSGYHAVMDFLGPGRSNGTPADKTKDPQSQKQANQEGFAVGDPSEKAQSQAEDIQKLREIMLEELEQGAVQVEAMDDRIVIRIDDSGAFNSGSADLSDNFQDLLGRLAPTLISMPGSISVAGHTDDRPIKSRRFRSNWDLSTARASAVVDQFITEGVASTRLVAQGFAESRPLVPNDTDDGRKQNRRVEISIVRSVERMAPP